MTTSYGTISLSQVQSEFGGSNPISLSEYYSNDSLVALGMSGVPSSGTISMGQLRGRNGKVGGFYNNALGSGVSYVDFTLPSERVWVEISMIGGGGGGGAGDGAQIGATGGTGGYLYCIVRLPDTSSPKTLRIYRGFSGAGGLYSTVGSGGAGGGGYGFSGNSLAAGNGGNGSSGGPSGGSGGAGGGGGMSCALYWDNANGIQVPIVAAAGGGGAGGAGQSGGERRGSTAHSGFVLSSTSWTLTGGTGAYYGGDNGAGGGGGGGGGAGGDFIQYQTYTDKSGNTTTLPANEASGYGGQMGSPQYNPALQFSTVYYGYGDLVQSYLGSSGNSGSGGDISTAGQNGQASVSWSSQVGGFGGAGISLS